MKLRLALWLACFLLVVGCAPTAQLPGGGSLGSEAEQERQYEIIGTEIRQQRERVFRVLNQIGRANVDLCGSFVANATGIAYFVLADMDAPVTRGLAKSYGMDRPGVVLHYLVEPASETGLKAGDRLASINGVSLSPPDRAMETMVAQLAAATEGGKPLRLRTEEGRGYWVQTRKVCNQAFDVVRDGSANAYADGSKITITVPLLNLIRSDDELAFVLAHEMTHNLYFHVQKQMGNAVVGAVLGYVLGSAIGVDLSSLGADAGRLLFSKDFEREADYIAVYLMARAGFDTRSAAGMMRKLALTSPSAIHANPFASHPSTIERVQLIERAALEIETKKAAGQALLPNMKRADVAASGG